MLEVSHQRPTRETNQSGGSFPLLFLTSTFLSQVQRGKLENLEGLGDRICLQETRANHRHYCRQVRQFDHKVPNSIQKTVLGALYSIRFWFVEMPLYSSCYPFQS
jgi:hypothetical protein